MHGNNPPRSEHHGFERECEERILGLPLHTRPHAGAATAAVRTRTRYVDERHPGVQSRERFPCGQRDVEGHAPVFLFLRADRRDSKAEEARVEAEELGLDARKVKQIGMYELDQLGIRPARTGATDREHFMHLRVEQAFAEDALPDHARRAEQDDFHGSRYVRSLRGPRYPC